MSASSVAASLSARRVLLQLQQQSRAAPSSSPSKREKKQPRSGAVASSLARIGHATAAATAAVAAAARPRPLRSAAAAPFRALANGDGDGDREEEEEEEDFDVSLLEVDSDSEDEAGGEEAGGGAEEGQGELAPPPREARPPPLRRASLAPRQPPPSSSSSPSLSAPIPEEEPEEDESEEALAARAAATALSGERLLRWLRASAAAAAAPLPPPPPSSSSSDSPSSSSSEDDPLPVAVVDLPKHLGGGRGLVATRDIAPGEALITVPLSLALVEGDPRPTPHPVPQGRGGLEGEGGFLSRAPWPVRMALELLERRAEARKKAAERELESALLFGGDGDGGGGGGGGGQGTGSDSSSSSSSSLAALLGESAWFDLLPPSIPLPTTTFTASELRAAALSPAALEYCRGFARGVRAAAEGPLRRRLEERAGARQGDPSPALVWATSAVQSRTFVLSLPGGGGGGGSAGVRRVLPPGIDFANHDAAAPTAEARVRHSPGAVQGQRAVEEVVDPKFGWGGGGGGGAGGESVIELVAGAEGIRSVVPLFFPFRFCFPSGFSLVPLRFFIFSPSLVSFVSLPLFSLPLFFPSLCLSLKTQGRRASNHLLRQPPGRRPLLPLRLRAPRRQRRRGASETGGAPAGPADLDRALRLAFRRRGRRGGRGAAPRRSHDERGPRRRRRGRGRRGSGRDARGARLAPAPRPRAPRRGPLGCLGLPLGRPDAEAEGGGGGRGGEGPEGETRPAARTGGGGGGGARGGRGSLFSLALSLPAAAGGILAGHAPHRGRVRRQGQRGLQSGRQGAARALLLRRCREGGGGGSGAAAPKRWGRPRGARLPPSLRARRGAGGSRHAGGQGGGAAVRREGEDSQVGGRGAWSAPATREGKGGEGGSLAFAAFAFAAAAEVARARTAASDRGLEKEGSSSSCSFFLRDDEGGVAERGGRGKRGGRLFEFFFPAVVITIFLPLFISIGKRAVFFFTVKTE